MYLVSMEFDRPGGGRRRRIMARIAAAGSSPLRASGRQQVPVPAPNESRCGAVCRAQMWDVPMWHVGHRPPRPREPRGPREGERWIFSPLLPAPPGTMRARPPPVPGRCFAVENGSRYIPRNRAVISGGGGWKRRRMLWLLPGLFGACCCWQCQITRWLSSSMRRYHGNRN
jgi:hypothetical protein